MKFFYLVLFLLATSFTHAGVNYNEYVEVKQALHFTYHNLDQSDVELSINTLTETMEENYWWFLNVSHASYVYSESGATKTHNIYLMGGLAREPYMTPDGLALIGCHELGHGIAGEPFKDTSGVGGGIISTEGQSDFFATKECLSIVLDYLPNFRVIENKTIYISLCEKQNHFHTSKCIRILTALESEMHLFNSQLKEDDEKVSFKKYSTHIQKTLNLSPYYYPDSQCRLDTMINGVLGLRRPECWYPGGETNGLFRN